MTPTIPHAATRLLLGACALLPFSHAAAAPAECVYSLAGKLPLRYTGPDLAITTGGSINGTPADMLVTTGAYQTFLTRSGIERHKLKLRNTGGVVPGIGGNVPVYDTLVQEFAAGPVRASRQTMLVLDNFGFTPPYDVILGSPFLLQVDLELSLATKELSFFVPKNCADTHLGYWAENVHAIPFEPHDFSGLNPHFIVHINGQKMVALINTGSDASWIHGKAARRAGIAFDAPGATRGEDAAGVGNGKRANWITTVATFQIGGETVRNAEFSVMESGKEDEGVDVHLGADFLRGHRVLFAMSQKKLYFSQMGGEPFGGRRKLAPWIQAEADNGNADAQLALANAYKAGKLVPRDEARAASWLEKAVAGGSPHALLRSGQDLVKRRDYAAAVPRLRAGLDKLPAERDAALTLYIARVRNGQAELAKTELAATFARTEGNEWPKPIADFYLGTLPLHKLLEAAADGRTNGKERRCSALSAIGDWHRAHGQTEAAKLRDEQMKTTCSDILHRYASIGD